MIGSSDPTPYDESAMIALACLGLILLAGVLTGHHWPSGFPTFVRRAAAILTAFVVGLLLFVTPSKSGIVGAGRLLTLWPLACIDIVLFAIWAWRAGRL